MQDFRVSRVAADPPVVPDAAEPGGSLDKVYYRLHGSPQVYYSAYANEYLDDLVIRLRAYAEAGVPTWCIFDNTARGEAIRNALDLTLKIARTEKTSAIGGEEFRRGLRREGEPSEGQAPRVEIRTFEEKDETEVIALWGPCGLLRPWNDPRKDIARKLHIQRDLFLVGTLDGTIVGSVMGGYEGHRGWVNYLAVEPSHRRRGIGRTLMKEIERRLSALGCPKVNLQIRAENEEAIQFYERIGFAMDAVLSMGKRLEHDER